MRLMGINGTQLSIDNAYIWLLKTLIKKPNFFTKTIFLYKKKHYCSNHAVYNILLTKLGLFQDLKTPRNCNFTQNLHK